MTAIAVTGAAGSVGRRVVERLATWPGMDEVRSFDSRELANPPDFPLGRPDPFLGCDSIVHLAEDPAEQGDVDVATANLRAVLQRAERADCDHLVLLSSALVYGAYPGNPIPLTEQHRRRPIPGLRYAATKSRLEEVAEKWAADVGAELAILRPTTTLSERGSSYIAGVLRAATWMRGDDVDAPVQFLHHDDLGSAVATVVEQRGSSIYNVAPDGWIGPDEFRDLLAEAILSWPEPFHEMYRRFARRVRPGLDVALVPHISYSWVVANDRLRSTGWTPAFSNEEALVLGAPTPSWRSFADRRRQELALGAVGIATAAAMTGAGMVARRALRNR